MTATEEDFIHYVDCIESLNCAWSILHELGTATQHSAGYAAFRFALIQYAKPYTRSDGVHRRRMLPAPQLGSEFLELHKRILDLRNKVLAHSDLTIKEARLHVYSIANRRHYGVISNSAEELPSREAVIELIERTLDQMYVESERRLHSLPREISGAD